MAPAAQAGHFVFDLVSTGPADAGASAADAVLASADGSVAFFNASGQLTADDTDAQPDVYRRAAGATTLVSLGPQGGNGSFGAQLEGITPDGQTVVFSTAEQLTAGDTDNATDLYKRTGNATTLVSAGPNGETGMPCTTGGFFDQGACMAFRGVSDDGRRVFFDHGGHLVPGDEEPAQCEFSDPEEGIFDVWPCADGYENLDGVTRLVTTGPNDPHAVTDHLLDHAAGGKAWFTSGVAMLFGDRPGIDAYEWSDGSLTAVTADATSSFTDFLATSDAGQRVFYTTGGDFWEAAAGPDTVRTPGTTDPVFFHGISGDGGHLYFSTQQALVPQDTDVGSVDWYEHTSAGYQLMTDSGGLPYNGSGVFQEATPSGSKAYLTTSERVRPEDGDTDEYDLYEFDSATGTIQLVSTGPTDPGEPQFGSDVGFQGVSDDGARVVFLTSLRLVAEDQNNAIDIYERTGGQTSIISITPDWSGGITCCGTNAPWPVANDGTKVFFVTSNQMLAADTDSVPDLYVVSRGDRTGYPRPASATPLYVSLVPAFQACTSPNRVHGPPLAFGSCTPPQTRTPHLTLGGSPPPAKSIGYVRLRTLRGAPGGPDDTDLRLELSLTHVMWQADLTDYTGALRAQTALQITDRDALIPGTMEVPFSFDAPCAATPDTTTGGECTLSTTADALVPGIVPEGSRAIWQMGQIAVLDGGADGDPATLPADSRVVATQGVFVP